MLYKYYSQWPNLPMPGWSSQDASTEPALASGGRNGVWSEELTADDSKNLINFSISVWSDMVFPSLLLNICTDALGQTLGSHTYITVANVRTWRQWFYSWWFLFFFFWDNFLCYLKVHFFPNFVLKMLFQIFNIVCILTNLSLLWATKPNVLTTTTNIVPIVSYC